MSQTDGCWWKAVEKVENYEEMRRRHREDDVVTPEEDARETAYVRVEVLGAVMTTAGNVSYAMTAIKNGPEAPRAIREFKSRAKRLDNLRYFPSFGSDGPDDDAGRLEAA